LPILVEIAVDQGEGVEAVLSEESEQVIGVNNRVHLAEAQAILRRRLNEKWMLNGVSIVDPAATYIDEDVEIGQDTVIYPNTHLLGQTRIGEHCRLGPNTIIRDSTVGKHCEILASVVESALLEDHVDVGPYGHLRKGAHLAQGVHMGNFGEVKNSYLGPGTKMGHFSYLGDANVEADVNIGAGTITCNYDGVKKHPTTIREGAFIGSDTMLVAPVEIGKGAKTGAGSVVTRDVAAGQVAYGVPARVHALSDQEGSQVEGPWEEKGGN
jgi:bifunctional UDP-N-acetylglucosamine pyrophosphorylase/glucosamine-1-phosphate N-acetyltransferase